MKNSKLVYFLITLFISASIFANSTGSKQGRIAFDNGQNGRSHVVSLNLPFKNASFTKQDDQHAFKVVDNSKLDNLNFSYKKSQNKNDNSVCLNNVTPCNNLNQAIDISSKHNGNRIFLRDHDSDVSNIYSYNGGSGWVSYGNNFNHHGSNDQFNNNNNGNHNGQKDDNGCMNPPSQLPVVPAPQAVFLTSTGLWVLSWLRRKF